MEEKKEEKKNVVLEVQNLKMQSSISIKKEEK